MSRYVLGVGLLVVVLLVAACGGGRAPMPSPLAEAGQSATPLSLTSPAFPAGGEIPRKYTCDGDDVSPPLEWGAPPPGTRSLALIMDDPDAPVGTWDHWLVYNLPADVRGLAEGVVVDSKTGAMGRHGKNSWGNLGYGGPCPPGGQHRYFFRVYALDTMLDLATGANKAQLLAAMAGHVLAQGELMGTYRR